MGYSSIPLLIFLLVTGSLSDKPLCGLLLGEAQVEETARCPRAPILGNSTSAQARYPLFSMLMPTLHANSECLGVHR
jgi:hypothetical protein